MVRQALDVDGYWEVIVYYDVDYGLFYYIANDLLQIGFTDAAIEGVRKTMESGEAKAVTCSHNHTSVVLFNKHDSVSDYISSIVHEAEHIKQAMLRAYRVEDDGEPPAYTVGYLVKRMWEVFSKLSSF